VWQHQSAGLEVLLCVTASVSRLEIAAVCDSISQLSGRCCCVRQHQSAFWEVLLCVTASVSRLGSAAVCDSISQQAGSVCCV
jgi:hypothetical protein